MEGRLDISNFWIILNYNSQTLQGKNSLLWNRMGHILSCI